MESEAASYIAMYKCKEELRSFYSCLKDNPGDDSICQVIYLSQIFRTIMRKLESAFGAISTNRELELEKI